MAEGKHLEVNDAVLLAQGPDPSVDEKIIRQHVAPQEFLKEQLHQANQAQVSNTLYPIYLTGIFDYLQAVLNSRLNKKHISQESYDLYLKKWNALETEYGRLGKGGFYKQLKLDEWRERFQVLNELIDMIGMGTSPPDVRKDTGPPLPMSAYHKCPENCPMLQKLREQHRRLE
jgi:hypothetical protein